MRLWSLALAVVLGIVGGDLAPAAEPARVLVVVGPSDHPPGSHEVAAGGRLIGDCLENAKNVPDIDVDVVYQWPEDGALIEKVQTVVFIGDTFPGERLPNSDVLYSDEDRLTAGGARCGPRFKPDWSPELMLSHNYVGRLAMVRAAVFEIRQDGTWRLRSLD